jgi:hypothetical protein
MSPAPSWLAGSRRRIFFDMHLPAWPGQGIAESFDPEELAGAIIASGADSAVIFAKCQYGNFYTRLPGERLHPGLGETDLLEEVCSRLRRGGVKPLAYYSVSWDERVADQQPEWLAEDAAGVRGQGTPRWRTLCINGPYADMVERHLVDIASKPVDGLWLDMTIVGDGYCYCPRCRTAFQDAHGRPLPSSPAEPGYTQFLEFRYGVVERFYARMRAALSKAAPQAVFTNNYWGYPWSSAAMGSRAVGATAQVDFLTGEAYSDWTGIRSTSMLPIFLRSAAAGRPFEALIGTGTNTWDFTRKPRAYLAWEAFSVFSHGAAVTVDDQPLHTGRFDGSVYRQDLREIFGGLSSLSRTVEGRHARHVSIYHSQRAKDRSVDQREFVKDICGAFRMFRDMRLPVDFTFDEHGALPDPAEVPVLALPDATELTASEWERLLSYARKGGLLVAAGGIGGDPAVLGALHELGIVPGKPAQYSLSYLRLPGAGARDLLVRGRWAGLSAEGPARDGVRGQVIEPICETGPTRFFHNNLPSPHRPSGVPGVVEVPLGAGALAVFPQPLFRHYAKEPSRELRGLVREILLRRGARPAWELRIPMRMDFSIVEAGDVSYVHLLNPSIEPSLCCGMMDIYDGAFERSYEYMEEEVPVHDLRILVRGRRVMDVSTLREHSPASLREADGGWEVAVDRVALYEVVQIRTQTVDAGRTAGSVRTPGAMGTPVAGGR